MRGWDIGWIFLSVLLTEAEADQKRRSLLASLVHPDRYDANIIPEFDEEYPTNVSLLIAITGMHSVSETTMDYSVDMTLLQRWRDHRLDYRINSTVEKLELDARNIDSVWQPDLFFRNEKKATVHTVTTTNKLMHIFRNGTVVYNMRMAVTLSCTMDLRIYPFDGQCCPIYIQSFAYSKHNIDLKWWMPGTAFINELDMPQFELSTDVDLFDYEEATFTGEYSTLRAELHMNRKSGFYFLQVFIPSVLLVALSWVSFWVDAAAVPARVSLGVTCILTMTTHSSGTRQTLPPVSYVKAIDVWMFVCLLFVFAALLEFAYVNVLLRRPRSSRKSTKTTEQSGSSSSDEEEVSPAGHGLPMKVDVVSRIAFPATFVLFVLVFALTCAFAPRIAFISHTNCQS